MNGDVLVVADVGRGSLAGEAVLTAFRRGLDQHSLAVTSAASDVSPHSWRELTRAVRRCRAVVFAGTSLIQSVPRALAIAGLARARGRTVCVVGTSASGCPDRTTGVLARGLARQADLMVVRDDATAHALIGLGLPGPMRVGADAAWTLLDNAGPGDDGDYVDRVVDVGPSTASLGHDAVRIDTGTDIVDLSRRVRGAKLVVSREFHVTAAAAAAGTPVLTIAQDDSERVLAERLGQPWVAPTASGPQMEEAVHGALDVPAPARAVVQAEIAASDETLALLRLMLSGGEMSAEDIVGLRLEPQW